MNSEFNKGPYSQSYGFSSGHVWMWELDHKEDWVPKDWSFWTVLLEKSLQSSLDCKKMKPVNSKGNQPWILTGRTDAEVEAPILWPYDGKSWLTRKDSDAGKGWKQEEKGTTEDEMVGWHHWLNGCEFEQALADGEGQGNLACCRSEVTKSQTQLSYWTRPKMKWHYVFLLMKSISILGLWAKSSLFGYPVFQQTTYSIKERVKKKMHTQTCLL